MKNKELTIKEILNDNIDNSIIKAYTNFKNAEINKTGLEEYFYANNSHIYWRNFYCGFVYPKNKDLAFKSIFITQTNDKYDYYKYSALAKITSGLYDKEECNKSRVMNLLGMQRIRIQACIMSRLDFHKKQENWIWSNYILETIRFAVEYLSLNNFLLKEETSFKNPEFNKEKALTEIKNHLNNYKSERMQDPIVSFIKDAPRHGISEEIYNEFVAKIRKKLGGNFCKEEEGYAREYFSERIPNPFEYR